MRVVCVYYYSLSSGRKQAPPPCFPLGAAAAQPLLRLHAGLLLPALFVLCEVN